MSANRPRAHVTQTQGTIATPVTQTRSLVTDDRWTAIAATRKSVAMTTFHNIATADDEAVKGYFHDDTAVLLRSPGNGAQVEATARRLRRLDVPVTEIAEPLDVERLS